jgi:integrase
VDHSDFVFCNTLGRFASLLITKGLNVVFVSRQLGHANPNVTLEVYGAPVRASRARRHRERGPGRELRRDQRDRWIANRS